MPICDPLQTGWLWCSAILFKATRTLGCRCSGQFCLEAPLFSRSTSHQVHGVERLMVHTPLLFPPSRSKVQNRLVMSWPKLGSPQVDPYLDHPRFIKIWITPSCPILGSPQVGHSNPGFRKLERDQISVKCSWIGQGRAGLWLCKLVNFRPPRQVNSNLMVHYTSGRIA